MGSTNNHLIQDFKRRIDLLSKISEHILGNESLHSTARSIMDTMRSHLDAYSGGLFLLDEDQKKLSLFAYAKTHFVDNSVKVIDSSLYGFQFPVDDGNMLLSECIREKRITESSRLSDFFAPVVPKKPQDIIQKLTRLKYSIGIPILVHGKAVGVLFAVFQKAKLSPIELSFFRFYANLSGLAIENSRKMDELETKYQLEKETSSMLSHELKTPIAIAHNSSQMMKLYLDKKRDKLGDLVHEFETLQQDVDASVKRLNYISSSIFELMETENKDTAVIHKLDFERQFDQVVQTYHRRSEEKGLDFSYDIQVAPGVFYGGGVQLEQVMTILLDNAVKYTKKGGIHLKITMDGKKMACEVMDTGPGIPKSKESAVFERFYRHRSLANRNLKGVEGLGLGLYVAKRIVQRLDGSIQVGKNPQKKGARFAVEMPVYTSMEGSNSA